MSIFDIAALLVGLAAVFGYVNHRFLRLPQSIGLLVIALVASLALLGLDAIVPAAGIKQGLGGLMGQIDFHEALMNGMLSFLLFAGALHVNLDRLRSRAWSIGLMASLGVVTSTFLVGTASWYLFDLLGMPVPYAYALVFGALISPTDPVAVLSILKSANTPASLEVKIAGESLFNDGVGVVVFAVLVAIAAAGGDAMGPGDVAALFALEAGGGVLLGLAGGYVVYRALAGIDDYVLEVMITLALVMVAQLVAHRLHVSAPLAVVVAGLMIGNQGMHHAMGEKTRDHVEKFWILLDEILNAVLFLLIGLEVLVLGFDMNVILATLITIPVVLMARFVAVSLPVTGLGLLGREFTRGAIPMLTWGGLRGGISVALALSLPDSEFKPLILSVTYGVVLFSIIVQGLSIKTVAQKVIR